MLNPYLDFKLGISIGLLFAIHSPILALEDAIPFFNPDAPAPKEQLTEPPILFVHQLRQAEESNASQVPKNLKSHCIQSQNNPGFQETYSSSPQNWRARGANAESSATFLIPYSSEHSNASQNWGTRGTKVRTQTVTPTRPKPKRDRNPFPTVQLSGEAAFMGTQAVGDTHESLRPGLGQRLRLDIEASFNSNDQLRLRLQNTNVAKFDDVFETDLARLSIQGDDGNEVGLSRLDYQFSIGERTEVFIPVVGGSISDVADTLNPGLSGSGSGSVARFSQRNPLYRQGGGAGVGIAHQVSDRLDLSIGYLSEAENLLPEDEYIAYAQATYELSDTVDVGLLYSYGFNALDTGTGQVDANKPFADQSDAIAAHSIGLQATAEVTPDLQLSAWTGFTQAIATDLRDTPNVSILNWAVALSSPDLLGKDNIGGFVIGSPPWVVSGVDRANPSLHLELFQQLRMNENITITPGIVVILNPQDRERSSNRPIVLGTVRMVFSL